MRLDQSSMDLATFADKIARKEIDLQPTFQRGWIWPESKKRRLIDTILREWYIPAIHLVINDEMDREEVLDGQQRLRTILEFMDGLFTVDGFTEPADDRIRRLDDLHYEELPAAVRARFRRFPITTVRLRDYKPGEPGELFFRLNQLTALTAAEQRNALVGEPRNQIKELAEQFEFLIGVSVGFSNARLNFDDVLSRLAMTIEQSGLTGKVTAMQLEQRYRAGIPFPYHIMEGISRAISTLAGVISGNKQWKQNKATLFSWLFFIYDNAEINENFSKAVFLDFFSGFETSRASISRLSENQMMSLMQEGTRTTNLLNSQAGRVCLTLYNDRSSSRVNDVSSVVLRDACLNIALFVSFSPSLAMKVSTERRLHVVTKMLDVMGDEPDMYWRVGTENDLINLWVDGREASPR
jgi:hypothetical protein